MKFRWLQGEVVLTQIFRDCNLGAYILCEEQKICLGPSSSYGLGREDRKSIFGFPSDISVLWQTAQTVSYLAQFNFIGNKPENML